MFTIYNVYVSYKGMVRVKHIFACETAFTAFKSKYENDSSYKLSGISQEESKELFIEIRSTPFINVHTDGMVHVGEVIQNGITCSRKQAYALPELADKARAEIDRINKARIADGNKLYDSSPWL